MINTDLAPIYSSAIPDSKKEGTLRNRCRHRPVQYLNNILEQDHRAIKRRVNAKQGFREFQAARRTIQGYEAIHMVRKGQVRETRIHQHTPKSFSIPDIRQMCRECLQAVKPLFWRQLLQAVGLYGHKLLTYREVSSIRVRLFEAKEVDVASGVAGNQQVITHKKTRVNIALAGELCNLSSRKIPNLYSFVP